jgi:hypothetical protein
MDLGGVGSGDPSPTFVALTGWNDNELMMKGKTIKAASMYQFQSEEK